MRGRALSAALLALALLAGPGALASAAEVTRDSYREAVEPICQEDSQANERIFKGVRQMVRSHELKRAATRFAEAAAALKQAVGQIAGLPRPAADAGRLAKWLEAVRAEAGLFEAVAAKLRAAEVPAAQQLVARLPHQANVANAIVVPFEFHYCRLEPARFT